MQLIRPDTNFDFTGKRKYAAVVSTFMVIASLLLFFLHGPTWGLDFTGGTEVRLQFNEPTEIGELRAALDELNLGTDAVQQIGTTAENEFVIRIQDTSYGSEEVQGQVVTSLESAFGAGWILERSFDAQVGARMTIRYGGPTVPVASVERALSALEGARVREGIDENTVTVDLPGMSAKIEQAIRAELAGRSFEVRNVESVGPKVGGELRQQGLLAIIAALALILVYVAFRFNMTFAPGAILATIHDVSITVGVFVLFDLIGWTHEFNLSMIGALLTIVGYSLNDTIVIYDRIRENMERYRRRDLERLINTSINETLGRTIATNFTTALAMVAFLVLGGPVIETFALAILLGIFLGSYSTVYIAAPVILIMEDLRPKFDRFFAKSSAQAVQSPVVPEGPAEPGQPEVVEAGPAVSASEQRRRERQARRAGQVGDKE